MSVSMCVSKCANEGQRATLGRQPSILFETGSLVDLYTRLGGLQTSRNAPVSTCSISVGALG